MQLDWWTLALQTLNVLVLVWLLGRFFFRPVAAIVARRQEEAAKVLADAEAIRREAEGARSRAEADLAGIGERRQAMLDEATRQAKAERESALAEGARDVARLRDEAAAAAARDRATADREMISRAATLALDIARRLLGRLPPATGFDAFVEELGRRARGLSPEARAGLAPATADEPVTVVAAADLGAAERQRVEAVLRDALGAERPLAFRRDPALLAGLEVHGRTTVLRNSWQADLEAIRQEIEREPGPRSA